MERKFLSRTVYFGDCIICGREVTETAIEWTFGVSHVHCLTGEIDDQEG